MYNVDDDDIMVKVPDSSTWWKAGMFGSARISAIANHHHRPV